MGKLSLQNICASRCTKLLSLAKGVDFLQIVVILMSHVTGLAAVHLLIKERHLYSSGALLYAYCLSNLPILSLKQTSLLMSHLGIVIGKRM